MYNATKTSLPFLFIMKRSVEMTRALTGSPSHRFKTILEGTAQPISSAKNYYSI